MLSLNVERRSTFTLTSDLSCIASILFANVTFTHVRTLKLRDIGYQPLTGGLSSKQQPRRWIPKNRIHATSNFIALIPSCSICQILANFLGLNYKDCTKVRENKKKVVVMSWSRPPENVKLGPKLGPGKEMHKKARCAFSLPSPSSLPKLSICF